MNFPANLKYSKEHEWLLLEGNTAKIGITDFAQKELGDIVYVDINTVGDSLAKDAVFGTIEAVKTVSDLFLPVAGKVLEMNAGLDSAPESINKDAYNTGWIVKIEIAQMSDLDNLMTADQYKAHIGV